MLDFIVLGLIPGTQIQLNFYELLSWIMCLFICVLLIRFIRISRAHRRTIQTMFTITAL
jgi:hypothetical protein